MPVHVYRLQIAVVCAAPERAEDDEPGLLTKPAAIAKALRFVRDGIAAAVPDEHLCSLVMTDGEGLGDERDEGGEA